ncbi:DUF3857 domain-containing protein [Corallococcus macrosporus]|uniref:DUF3857 domain-containing protein n=1 Tax=Corallococcus macrosporus TaxID=35 RepID=A0ABS3DN99_9BACT|nr:DUF3857 domain-containing protein [Corallococcus macrosporus]MBN8232797.1 DUF3857 domain-containing protein [Corallococcus macrosporus]
MPRIFRPVLLAPGLSPASVLLLCLCLSLSTGTARAATPALPFRVGPPAAWVKPLPIPADSGPASAGEEETSVSRLLVEEQVRVSGHSQEHYLHSARKVLSPQGIDSVTDIQLSFDPTYQKLTVHGIWRIRDGRREDLFQPAEARVIQQEPELQNRLYNGALSVVPFLRDVRVGDTVEVAYTLEGANPVFGGRFSDFVVVGKPFPVGHFAYRLLWPEGRSLYVRDFAAPGLTRSEALLGNEREIILERRHVPAVHSEDNVPGWQPVYPWLQLSEYKDWNDVARWASALFQVPARSKALEQEIRRLSKEPTPEARFVAALRFVQDEVRYLGIEMGPNSHQPHPPDEVLQRRFGDCKDKSLLLVTLLKGLGIDAQPALVNTGLTQLLDGWRPTARAFDHAIVHATVGGRELWVDPTATLERGGLDSYEPPPYGRALIVAPGTTELSVIPAPTLKEPSVFVDETYVATDRDGPATLDVVTTRTGESANAMRRMLAGTSVSELSRFYFNYYAKKDAKITVASPMTVDDDTVKNVLVVHEHYRIEDFWSSDARRDFSAHTFHAYLKEPGYSRRAFPLEVEHPVFARHRITLKSGEPLHDGADHDVVDGPAFHFEADTRADGKTLVLDYRYQSLADAVPPERIAEYVKAVRATEDNRGYYVQLGSRERRLRTSPPPSGEAGAILLGVIATCVVLWFVIAQGGPVELWRKGRAWGRRRAFARKFDASHQGDSAWSAIPITGPQELLSTLGRLRCACGATSDAPRESLRHEAVVLGERHLTLVQWQCPTCARARRAYFEDKGSRAA